MTEILKAPHEALSAVCVPATDLREAGRIANDLMAAMRAYKGRAYGREIAAAGLAAPQIGVCKRVIVVKINGAVTVMINPRILRTGDLGATTAEGCLSLEDGCTWEVRRPVTVMVEWTNRKGKLTGRWFVGFDARVVQHELDHLDGVLVTDRAGELLAESA